MEYRRLRHQGKMINPKDLRGDWVIISGRCPECGRWAGRVLLNAQDRTVAGPALPEIYNSGIRCCLPVIPTHLDFFSRGKVTRHTTLRQFFDRPIGDEEATTLLNEPLNWAIFVLQELLAKDPLPGKVKMPRSGHVFLDRVIEMAECYGELYAAKVLRFCAALTGSVSWEDLAGALRGLYSYVHRNELPSGRAEALFAAYRCIYSAKSGASGLTVVARDGKIHHESGYIRVGMSQGESISRRIWPSDLMAMTAGFFSLEEALGILKTMPFTSRLGPTVELDSYPLKEAVRFLGANKVYALNPAGVVARLFRDIPLQLYIREDGDYVVGWFETDNSPAKWPIWLNWREGFGFSPLQVFRGFVPEDDGLLAGVMGVFIDLAVTPPDRLNKRVVPRGRHSAILLPGEGRVDAEPRYVYFRHESMKKHERLRRPLVTVRTSPVLHGVAGHLRRAKKASETAVENAQKYGVILPPGYTFVRPHMAGVRKQDVDDGP